MTGKPSLRGSLIARWTFAEPAPPFASDDGSIGLLDGVGSAVTTDGGGGEPRSASFDGRADYLVASSEALKLEGAERCSIIAWVAR